MARATLSERDPAFKVSAMPAAVQSAQTGRATSDVARIRFFG
jgi:hypothetical protein